ncbi:unnamed protein product [Spirodela intermedia]|uniref:Uncharacterized protein n=1 Tax=Spirodela intermedia TaxID=51605 RepID=A0A7I8JFC6_SPIIN|nr:unnamed protein product [Spirodela intermedia]CAA6668847.1 unnamed protein product [Spirodela intermedia]
MHPTILWELYLDKGLTRSLNYQHKQLNDASCSGYYAKKSEDHAYNLLEEFSLSYNYASSDFDKTNPLLKKDGVYELMKHADKNFRNEVNEINKKLEKLPSSQDVSNSQGSQMEEKEVMRLEW